MTTVYLAQRLGETCHFGVESTARAWAGKNGTVQIIHKVTGASFLASALTDRVGATD